MSEEAMGKMLVKLAEICNQLADPSRLKSLNADTLSYTASRMAAMKASIVDMKVDAEYAMRLAEIDMDEQKAKAYERCKEKHGATAAKDMKYSDPDYMEARAIYAETKRDYEKLRSVTSDTHDLIESLVNRTISMSQSMKDERLT